MTGVPYPPQNCRIVFREPFPREENHGGHVKLYIRAIIDEMPEREIRMDSLEQTRFVDDLVRQDGKLLNAEVLVKDGKFVLLRHSPQIDFFKEVDKCIQ